ncbi:hypothetical protein QBC38DRAFT_439042 [Podospora fimiseda]|uniref:Uncharacterized protein n=1 Tax=Podospora fimiseda TaxID=252190 RepID=A0AAN7C023_9PEZI|nr:hypothetical protein QBC38DRAFT_439042 [Podospora fimiseda]
MIKTTTRSARRLGTKLLDTSPRRRTADVRGTRILSSQVSSTSPNLVALSRRRPDINSNQLDPIPPGDNGGTLPKRREKAAHLRKNLDRSNAPGNGGERATNSSNQAGKMNSTEAPRLSTSCTNHPRSNRASQESLEDVIVVASQQHTPSSSSVKSDTLASTQAKTRPSLKPLNMVRGRYQQLLDLEAHQKRTAIEKYKATGDPAHFLPFLGPFVDTNDGNGNNTKSVDGHEEWQWDKETERHWREGGKATGTRIWAPVKESFI